MLVRMPGVTIGLVLDCRDPESLATFWTKALGLVHLGSVENYALLASEDGQLPKLLLQKVDDAKAGRTACTSTSKLRTSMERSVAWRTSVLIESRGRAGPNTGATGW